MPPCPTPAATHGPDSDREDYVIRCEGLDVGRVYRTRLPHGDRFVWSIYMNGHVPQVDGVPISGAAPDLDAAATQFTYETMRARAGLLLRDEPSVCLLGLGARLLFRNRANR